jgi:hypothetical protein
MEHSKICLVRAPNRQLYLINTGSVSIVIENVSKNTLVYEFSQQATYLFHSMPIANSFVLFVMRSGNEIVIHVIDLIKEIKYVQKYLIEKIIETLISLSKENDKYYEELKSIKNLGNLSLKITDKLADVTNTIDNSIFNLVFYDSCIVNISLSFGHTDEPNSKTLKDALSIVAVYQNNELTVRLQINSNIKIEMPSYNYGINFGSSTVLTDDKYIVDNKYNLSQSHLYSVMASGSDYTIISEHNIGKFALYYKNEADIIFPDKYFSISNLGNILFISTFGKKLVFVSKDRLFKLNKINKYYVLSKPPYIDIIDA